MPWWFLDGKSSLTSQNITYNLWHVQKLVLKWNIWLGLDLFEFSCKVYGIQNLHIRVKGARNFEGDWFEDLKYHQSKYLRRNYLTLTDTSFWAVNWLFCSLSLKFSFSSSCILLSSELIYFFFLSLHSRDRNLLLFGTLCGSGLASSGLFVCSHII